MKFASAVLVLVFVNIAYGQQDGTVALLRNEVTDTSFTSGIVQVYYDGEWEGICNDDSFNITDANIICHQLGYTNAESYSTAGNTNYGTIDNATYTNVQCANDEFQVFYQCSFGRDGCDPMDAVTVNCNSTRVWDDPYDGQIRLQGGEYSSEGTVEIYCNEEWGSVCISSEFGTTEAGVVCDQLGYDNGASQSPITRNNDSQPVWLDDPSCSSILIFNCLSQCQSCPSADAAISCTSGTYASVECSSTVSSSNDNTLDTCDLTDIIEALRNLVAIIVGVIIACCVVSIILAILPFCICCCLGVGVCAAASKA